MQFYFILFTLSLILFSPIQNAFADAPITVVITPSSDQSFLTFSISAPGNQNLLVDLFNTNTTVDTIIPLTCEQSQQSPMTFNYNITTLFQNCSFKQVTLPSGDLQYTGAMMVYQITPGHQKLIYRTNITITRLLSSTGTIGINMSDVINQNTQITSIIASTLVPCNDNVAILSTSVSSLECLIHKLTAAPVGVIVSSVSLSLWQNNIFVTNLLAKSIVSNLSSTIPGITEWIYMSTTPCISGCYIQSTIVFSQLHTRRRLLSITSDESLQSNISVIIRDNKNQSVDSSLIYIIIMIIFICISCMTCCMFCAYVRYMRYIKNREQKKSNRTLNA